MSGANFNARQDTSRHHSRLLRTVAKELTDNIAPLIESSHAVEKLRFAAWTLEQLAADLVVAPDLLPELRDAYRGGIADAVGELGADGAGYVRELDGIEIEDGLAAQRETAALRDVSSRLLQALADAGAPTEGSPAEALGRTDLQWVTRFDAGKAAMGDLGADGAPAAAAAPGGAPDAKALTDYLRARLPNSPGLEVTNVAVVPGGRSKRTVAITVAGTDELPADLIMRQDMALKYAGPTVVDEVKPLARLAELGVTAPRPLVVELEDSAFGKPFFICERFPGSPPGEYFGLWTKCPGAMRDLAQALGRLHSIAPADLGFDAAEADASALLTARIGTYWKSWRDNSTRGSPLIDYAFAWSREKSLAPYSAPATVIHGDIGAYNLLVHDDRLTAILDWEFIHIGDPAEDLGLVRPIVKECMDWEEFLAIYRAAGGAEVPEERVDLGELLNWLKGCHLVATSGRNFVEGGTSDFIKGANSFTGLRRIELKIAGVLGNAALAG